jgi:hypothetical protein
MTRYTLALLLLSCGGSTELDVSPSARIVPAEWLGDRCEPTEPDRCARLGIYVAAECTELTRCATEHCTIAAECSFRCDGPEYVAFCEGLGGACVRGGWCVAGSE